MLSLHQPIGCMTVLEILDKDPKQGQRVLVQCACGEKHKRYAKDLTSRPPAYCKRCAKSKRHQSFIPRGRISHAT